MFFPCVSMYLFGTSPPGIVKIPLVRKKFIRTAFVRLTIIVSSSSAARRRWMDRSEGAHDGCDALASPPRKCAHSSLSLFLSLAGWPKEGARERLRAMPCGFVVRPSLRPSAVPPISLSLLHYQNGGPAPRPVCFSALLLPGAADKKCQRRMDGRITTCPSSLLPSTTRRSGKNWTVRGGARQGSGPDQIRSAADSHALSPSRSATHTYA